MTENLNKLDNRLTDTKTPLNLVLKALRLYIKSEDFVGVFTPGLFYEFCGRTENFTQINKDYVYANDLRMEDICEQYKIVYRKSKPVETSDRSAKNMAKDLLILGRQWKEESQTVDLTRYIAHKLNKKLSVANNYLHRSIGRENLLYILKKDFNINTCIPRLGRDDLKAYFTFLRENSLTSLVQFKDKIITLIESASSEHFSFQIKSDKRNGWIYAFVIEVVGSCQLIKCGQTERTPFERLEEHFLTSLFPDNSWGYVFRSSDVDKHEKNLIEILSRAGRKKEGTNECFLISDNFQEIWSQFLSKINENDVS